MKPLLRKIFAVSALTLAAGSVSAFDQQPYIGAMGLGYFPDSVLELDNGVGGRLLLGLPLASHLNVEFNAFGYGAEPENSGAYYKQFGGGMDFVVPFTKGRSVTPFFLIGGGYNSSDSRDIPQLDNGYANAGLGLLASLGGPWSLRAEGRYIALFPDGAADIDQGHLDEAVAGLGLQYSFAKPTPPPEPAPAPAAAPPPPPPDSDGDGVIDSLDQCPNTPKGVQVDTTGCPLDGDGDGVPDYLDKCPNTTPGLKVDATGCVREAQTIVLQNVNFEFDKATLTPDARVVLAKVAQGLVSQKDLKVEIAGHTDSKGSDGYNQRLSGDRAASVKTFLISQGVAPQQLVSRGYGEAQPVATNDTEEGRAQNRRVEFRVLSLPQGARQQ